MVWQAQRANLLPDKQLQSALLANKDYVKIGPCATRLDEKLKLVKRVHRIDGQCFVDATCVSKCMNCIDTACDTVGTTFILHRINQMLPKFKDLDQRRKAVASLRMDVATFWRQSFRSSLSRATRGRAPKLQSP